MALLDSLYGCDCENQEEDEGIDFDNAMAFIQLHAGSATAYRKSWLEDNIETYVVYTGDEFELINMYSDGEFSSSSKDRPYKPSDEEIEATDWIVK